VSIVADLTRGELAALIAAEGITIGVFPFSVRLRSALPQVVEGVHRLYGRYPLRDGQDEFADFHIDISRGVGLRRFIGKRQSLFLIDGFAPFKPLPADQAYPSFEWGLNWCVANHCHQYLVLHAAVIERNGLSAILAAPPGSGKSTLCAGLVHRGWRLFSDELALIHLATGRVDAFPRPICLKNESIDVIRQFVPDSSWGPMVHETRKGSVTHLRPPDAHIVAASQPARPRWIVFPQFRAGSPVKVAPKPKARAALALAANAFNFDVLGELGFEALSRVVQGCDAYEFSYGDLDDAQAFFDELAAAP
jgi:HprK-related kinase A